MEAGQHCIVNLNRAKREPDREQKRDDDDENEEILMEVSEQVEEHEFLLAAVLAGDEPAIFEVNAAVARSGI